MSTATSGRAREYMPRPPAQGDPCSTCSTNGRKGYCALGRCYCGHETCHGYDSWSPLPEPVLESVAKKHSRASAWDTREESTWIDGL